MLVEKYLDKMVIAGVFIFLACCFIAKFTYILVYLCCLIPAFYVLGRRFVLKKKIYFSWSQIFLLLFVLCGILSVIFSDYPQRTLKNIMRLKVYILGALLPFALTLIDVNKIKTKGWIVFCSSIGIAATYAILKFGYQSIILGAAVRAEGFTTIMTLGYAMSLVCSLLASYLFYSFDVIKAIKYKIVLVFILAFLALLFSGCRGPLVSFIVSLPFLFFRTSLRKTISLIMLSVALLFGSYVGVKQLNLTCFRSHHFSSIFSSSSTLRISQWKAGVLLFKENPALGVGYANFAEPAYKKVVENKYYNNGMISHAHNIYVEVLATTGLLGAISFGLFLLFFGIELLKSNLVICNIGFIVYLNFLLGSFLQSTILDAPIILFCMMAYGFLQYSITKEQTC